jgi:hypothetical protein
MTRWMLTLVVLLLVLPAVVRVSKAADAPSSDGNKLLRDCTSALRALDSRQGDSNAWLATGWCLGYILGFRDGHLTATDTTMPDDMRKALAFCDLWKHNITAEQSARILVEWLRTHPKLLHLPQHILTAWALADAFPCPSSITMGQQSKPSTIRQPPVPKTGKGGQW